eukprot:4910124-Pyramimonas_sp.AAC.1
MGRLVSLFGEQQIFATPENMRSERQGLRRGPTDFTASGWTGAGAPAGTANFLKPGVECRKRGRSAKAKMACSLLLPKRRLMKKTTAFDIQRPSAYSDVAPG